MSTAGVETFVFDSTNGAFWAEEVAGSQGVPVEVVPAPVAAGATCDLALITKAEGAPRLERALADEGVPFRVWQP